MQDVVVVQNTSIVEGRNVAVDETLLDRYIRYLDATPKTVESYYKTVKQLINYFAINGINYPQREDIIAFREDLKASGHKPTTIQNYITGVKIFFRWTAQEGLYPNIADHLKGAKLDREHKKDYLSSRQIKDVLSHINQNTKQGIRDYAMVTLMVTGGLRDIEVVRANVGDLRVCGDNTVLYLQGKGHSERTEYVKISAQVEKALRAYLKTRGGCRQDEPLFTSMSNNSMGSRLTTRSVSGIVKNLLRTSGYDSERLTAHSLRHTAVTLALLAGKDITEVQQFARHANIATTMIYNHSLDKAKNSCGEAIANAIF